MGERERERETGKKIDWWFGLVSGLARWPMMAFWRLILSMMLSG